MMNTQTVKAAPLDNTRDNISVSPMMPDANDTRRKVQDDNKTASAKRGKRNKTITIVYANEMPAGVFEKALANIYAVKIKSGDLDFCDNLI